MPVTAMRILIAGRPAPGTNAMLARLGVRGFESHAVKTLREARDQLGTFRFDVVLAAESAADGRGCELAKIVARRSGTLLVGVAPSESWPWLPVVERDVLVLGRRAFNAPALGLELDFVLDLRALSAPQGNMDRNRRLKGILRFSQGVRL